MQHVLYAELFDRFLDKHCPHNYISLTKNFTTIFSTTKAPPTKHKSVDYGSAACRKDIFHGDVRGESSV